MKAIDMANGFIDCELHCSVDYPGVDRKVDVRRLLLFRLFNAAMYGDDCDVHVRDEGT